MPDMTKAEVPAAIETDLIVWAAVHGSLCLALRHPQLPETSRKIVEAFVTGVEAQLVAGGLFTREEMEHAHNVEQEVRTRRG